MSVVSCPHCAAPNSLGSAFCQACGKALPSPTPSGPRVVTKAEFATTTAGQTLQSDQLRQQVKKASCALLIVAIMQVLFGVLILTSGMIPGVSDDRIKPGLAVYLAVFGVGTIFFILYLWARRSPLPAAIVGLVLFITLHLMEAIANPAALCQGVILKAIVILVLAKAIQVGLKHRQLLQQGG